MGLKCPCVVAIREVDSRPATCDLQPALPPKNLGVPGVLTVQKTEPCPPQNLRILNSNSACPFSEQRAHALRHRHSRYSQLATARTTTTNNNALRSRSDVFSVRHLPQSSSRPWMAPAAAPTVSSAYKRLLTKCADHITGRECCKRARATTGQAGQTGPAAKEALHPAASSAITPSAISRTAPRNVSHRGRSSGAACRNSSRMPYSPCTATPAYAALKPRHPPQSVRLPPVLPSPSCHSSGASRLHTTAIRRGRSY